MNKTTLILVGGGAALGFYLWWNSKEQRNKRALQALQRNNPAAAGWLATDAFRGATQGFVNTQRLPGGFSFSNPAEIAAMMAAGGAQQFARTAAGVRGQIR